MSQEKRRYDQIRYLGNSGMETIRVKPGQWQGGKR